MPKDLQWRRCKRPLKTPELNFSAVERGQASDSAISADRMSGGYRGWAGWPRFASLALAVAAANGLVLPP
jgi:hypothetical protein